MRYCGTVAKVRFYVMPNAKQDTVAGEHAGAIKIKLRAPRGLPPLTVFAKTGYYAPSH